MMRNALLWGLLTVLVCGCGYAAGYRLPGGVEVVNVPVFDNQTFPLRRDVELDLTRQIVTLLTGDQEFNSPKTLSAFALGLSLFIITLILNMIASRVVQRYRKKYGT